MKTLLLFVLIAFLASCNQRPKMTMADGRVVDLGRSALTKSKNETASYTAPGGESLKWSSSDRDETVVPTKVIGSYTTLGLAGYARDAFRSTESTKRVLGAQEVQKTGIQSAERIRTTEILNPAPEAITPAVAPIATP